MNVDIFEAVDIAVNRQRSLDNGLNIKSCLKIFGVSKQGYDAWNKLGKFQVWGAKKRRF